MTGLTVLVIIFLVKFPLGYNQFPRKWPFQLEALYFDIDNTGLFWIHVFIIIIACCLKLCLSFLKSLKTLEKLPVELFFKVTAERDYGLVTTGEIKIFLRISCERRYNPVSENNSNNLQKNNRTILREINHLFSWE